MPTLRMSASKGPHSRPEAGLRRGIFQSPGRTRTGMDADVKRKQLAAALNGAAQGDRAALRLIYGMTSAKLFGVCLSILNDRSEAEDVLQEVYLTVWIGPVAVDYQGVQREQSVNCNRIATGTAISRAGCTHKSRWVSSRWSTSVLPPEADIRRRIEYVR